jgi:glycosyltransferase involved in cell wall biosynthesis
MINNKTIAVIVPAYNEEKQISMVIETMPGFVDRIVIVNDCSTDKTKEIVEAFVEKFKMLGTHIKVDSPTEILNESIYNKAEIVLEEQKIIEEEYYTEFQISNIENSYDRVILINHLYNGGVGAAIASGYKWARDNNIDCTAVMAGDGQMDPSELYDICLPIVNDGLDYVKGNRLIHRSALLVIPKVRYLGNSVLSILTKIASGYWHVSDTQTGFTAISKSALNAIRIHEIFKSYGMPNDMLVKLNIAMCTIKEVPIKPIYDIGEQSKMKIAKVIPKISILLLKSFFKRLWFKYLFRDFHPLFLLYHLSFLMFMLAIPLGINISIALITEGYIITNQFLMIFIFLATSSFQSLLFAMWMDIQDNERLYK